LDCFDGVLVIKIKPKRGSNAELTTITQWGEPGRDWAMASTNCGIIKGSLARTTGILMRDSNLAEAIQERDVGIRLILWEPI